MLIVCCAWRMRRSAKCAPANRGVFRLGEGSPRPAVASAPILSRYHGLYPDVGGGTRHRNHKGTRGPRREFRALRLPLSRALYRAQPPGAPRLRGAAGACDIKAVGGGVGPADLGPQRSSRSRREVLLSQAHRGMAGYREYDARADHGICLVPGDDRLRRCRNRICRGTQVCPGHPARNQERTPTRAA